MTTTITTRVGKGGRLSFTEMDANFTNLKATADAAAVQATTYLKSEVDSALATKQPLIGFTPINANTIGAASGLATLDATGKLTTAQIPTSLVGAVVYQGVWNANTNLPALTSGTGNKGHYYKVNVTGSTAVDGISQWNIGDVIIFNGTTWDKIDGVASEVVTVAGRTGSVVLTAADVSGVAKSGSNSDITALTGLTVPYLVNPAKTYAILNVFDKSTSVTLTNGSLGAIIPANSGVRGTQSIASGSVYWETRIDSAAGVIGIGIAASTVVLTGFTPVGGPGYVVYYSNGIEYAQGGSLGGNMTFTTGDVIGVNVNYAASTVVFYKNGVQLTTLSGALFPSGPMYPFFTADTDSVTITTNFGASPFSYAVPTGSLSGVYSISSPASIVTTVAGRLGDVFLTAADIVGVATSGANSNITSITGLTTALSVAQGGTGVTTSTGTGSGVHAVSPAFTGTPTAPTAATANNSTALATTAFVKAQGYLTSNLITSVAGRTGAVVLTAADVSGAATSGANLNITSLAGLTTALSVAQGGTGVTTSTGTGSGVHAVSPVFTGTPSAPTAATADNSTTLATTAFVKAQGYLTSNLITSVAGRTGAVVLTAADVSGAAPLASPVFTGTVSGTFSGNGSALTSLTGANVTGTVPLATSAVTISGTYAGSLTSSQVTTGLGFTPYNATNPSAYITSAGVPVQSVFGRTGAVVLASSDVTTALGFTPVSAGNNISLSLVNGAFGSATLTTSATTVDQIVDSIPITAARSVKYLIQITSGTSYHATEILIIHDGTTAYVSQSNDVFTGVSLASFNSYVAGGNLLLLVTPVNAASTIKVIRTSVAV